MLINEHTDCKIMKYKFNIYNIVKIDSHAILLIAMEISRIIMVALEVIWETKPSNHFNFGNT